MKTYKNSEVFAMLEKNPKSKFKCKHEDTNTTITIYINDFGYLTMDNDGCSNYLSGNIRITDEWHLVQQPVTFMDAVNSGKKIRYEIWGYSSTLENALETIYRNCESIQRRMLNGKWYVEEEE